MADNLEDNIINDIATNSGDDELITPVASENYEPVYRISGENKIPVSKHAGPLWASRKDASIAKMKDLGYYDSWDEAIRYYTNDQTKQDRNNADSDTRGIVVRSRARKIGTNNSGQGTENIVFANTTAMVPSLYAKNPICEVTPNIRDDNEEDENAQDDMLREMARVGERLVNALLAKKEAPGVGLKARARRCVIMTTLCNVSYVELGYTKREEASEQAYSDLQKLAEDLQTAKDQAVIQEIEGKLQAIESKISFLRPAGPWVKYKHPKDVLRDPNAMEADGSDAQWMMIADYVSTEFINAVYREKDSETQEYKNIFSATHVQAATSSSAVQQEINTFTLINKEKSNHRDYGYKDEDSFRSACMTKVWCVWDKTTRRVYMFNDGDWSWPIWVWEDPYNLEGFFPIRDLQFYTDPEVDIGQSEVAMYLDQQDELNVINGEWSRIIERLTGSAVYNKSIIKDRTEVEKYISGSQKLLGLDLPPDADITKVLSPGLAPSTQYAQLLDKKRLYEIIDRQSSVSPIMRGEEFKTNTTNQAINTYNSMSQTRLDEKIDAVEDFIGEISWAILQMCLQFMSPQEVAYVVGDKDATRWKNMQPDDICKSFSVQVVGGSTQKPTSNVKKQQALQIGQVLGQFANAGGGATIELMLKVFERAFDEVIITDEDWKMLRQAVMTNLQRGQSTGAAPADPNAPPEAPQPPAQGQAPTDAQGQVAGPAQSATTDLGAIIDSLPPNLKQALGTVIQQGVPVAQAVAEMIGQLQSQVPTAH